LTSYAFALFLRLPFATGFASAFRFAAQAWRILTAAASRWSPPAVRRSLKRVYGSV